MHPRRLLVAVPATLLALAGVLSLAALALPRHVQVQRSAVVQAEPAEIRALLASTAGFQRINPFKAGDPGLIVRPIGPPQGVGAAFDWQGREGTGRQTVVAVEPGRVTMQLDLGPMGRPLQSFLLKPAAGGTRVVWRLEADLGFNPIARAAGLMLDGRLGPHYEQGLRLLAAATTASPIALSSR